MPDDFVKPPSVVLRSLISNTKNAALSGILLNLVVASGLEPPTPTMSRWCSNQLSYATILRAGILP